MLLEKHRGRIDELVPVGTPIQRAATVFPKAHNSDTGRIWAWSSSPPSKPVSWKMLNESSACFFVMIVDGRTATPLCGNAALTPAGALMIFKGWSQAQADAYVTDQ